MKLVENWRHAWKWLSVQLAILAGGVEIAMLHPALKNWISDELGHSVGALLLASIVVGRMIDQKKPGA